MFKKFLRKSTVDPIAKRLHEKPAFKAYTQHKDKLSWPDLQSEHGQWAASQPQASYEAFEVLHSEDPRVLDFIRTLGLEPDTIERLVITVEIGQPVRLAVHSYAIENRKLGSVYTADGRVNL